MQTLLLIFLHLWGIFWGLVTKKQLPVSYICITGLLWGSLIWGIAAISAHLLGLPFSLPTMIVLVATLSVPLVFVHLRNGTWRLGPQDIAWIAGSTAIFTMVAIATTHFNFARVTPDSISQIMLGKSFAEDGFTAWNTGFLGDWGVLLSILHSSSALFGEDYMIGLHPAFAVVFLNSFYYICYRSSQGIASNRLRVICSLTATLLLASTYFISFQIFYIHNNFPSGVYLFTALGSFWFYLHEKQPAWLGSTIIGLFAFSLLRVEAPIFTMLFLTYLISSDQPSNRFVAIRLLLCLITLILWYIYLLFHVGSVWYTLLDPQKTLIVVGCLILFTVFAMLRLSNRMPQRFVPIIPYVPVVVLLLLIVGLFIAKPSHMFESLLNFLQNMFSIESWGYIWVLAVAMLPLFFIAPQHEGEKVFSLGIPSFFLLVLALAFPREPYRLGWGDSANRMLLHIIPIVYFFYLLKINQILSKANLAYSILESRG